MMKNKKWLKEILEIVAAFVAAWVFYQLLALAAHTSTPIVSVASLSMFHDQHFDDWWNQKLAYYESIGIDKGKFSKFAAKNGLNKGDILFIVRDEKLEVGDIIVYHPQSGCFSIDETIVHRIIKAEGGALVTKGDNNPAQDKCTVQMSQIEGKTVLAVPLLGYPRLWLEEILVRLR